ncbi:MAG: hypothetical protein ABJN14_11725 [Paracoccaceae bacterium]
MTHEDFEFDVSGRRPATGLVVAGVWGVLILAVVVFGAAMWLVAVFALFTLPALYDLLANPKAGMRFGRDTVRWFSGSRDAELPWDQVDRVRLDTRLDLSVRACFILITGRKVRVPFEATPPHEQFESALVARGVKVERHHFSLVG